MSRKRLLTLVVAGGAVLGVAACQGTPPPVPQSPVQTSMRQHFALARDLRSFAVAGWLDTLRATAAELARTEEAWGLPPGRGPALERTRTAAQRAADAPDLQTAIPAVAELAQECGSCHLANEVDLGRRFRIVEPLPNGSVSRHMNRLAWASRLLWDGLVGPSDRTWQAGAEALANSEDLPDAVAQRVQREEMIRAAVRLRELGGMALGSDEAGERVGIVTEVWRVCADCHVGAGVR